MSGQGAQDFHRAAIVVDGLNVSNWGSAAVPASLHAGGVTAINATCAIWEGYTAALDNVAVWLHRFDQHRDSLVQVKTVDDIMRAKRTEKTGVILGWQNASPIEDRLERLALAHDVGIRIIQLTFNERNRLGNGCYERADEGLSHFGVEAVREMNRLGILVDLSHVGDRSTLDAIDLSVKPVACTHANARAFFDHPRNKTDEALRRLAARGGVVGATAFPPFLRHGFESTLADYVDAVDDLVDRIGIEHVAIGTDYTQDQPPSFFEWCFAQQGTRVRPEPLGYPERVLHPRGMETPDGLPNLTEELLRRGYRPADVAKVLGGNWLRLFTEVWVA